MEDVFNANDPHIQNREQKQNLLRAQLQAGATGDQGVGTGDRYGKVPGQNPTHKTYNGPSHMSQYNSSFREGAAKVAVANPVRITVAISPIEA